MENVTNINIDNHKLLAPVTAASLLNALYLRAAQEPGDGSFMDKVQKVLSEVLETHALLLKGLTNQLPSADTDPEHQPGQ